MEARCDGPLSAAKRRLPFDLTDEGNRRQREADDATHRARRYRLDNLLAERYGGFRELTVVGELKPAHQVFGPNGADVLRLIDRSQYLDADELQRLAAAQHCPHPISASTLSIDQAEAHWWATKSLAVCELIEEAAYEAGRRGAKQCACNATGKGREEEALSPMARGHRRPDQLPRRVIARRCS